MPVTNFIWDELSDNVRMEVNETGAVTAEYMNEPGQFGNLLSQRRDGTNSFYHFDAQGSARQLTNDAETVTDSYSYTAFGEPVSSTGSTSNPYRYNASSGFYSDGETGDVYIRARYYDPTTGEFTSRVPPEYVDGMSLYVPSVARSKKSSGIVFGPSDEKTLRCPRDCWADKTECNYSIITKGDRQDDHSFKNVSIEIRFSPCRRPLFDPNVIPPFDANFEPVSLPCDQPRFRSCFADVDRESTFGGYIAFGIGSPDGHCVLTSDNFPPGGYTLIEDTVPAACRGLVQADPIIEQANDMGIGFCGVIYTFKDPIRSLEMKFNLRTFCGCTIGSEDGIPYPRSSGEVGVEGNL